MSRRCIVSNLPRRLLTLAMITLAASGLSCARHGEASLEQDTAVLNERQVYQDLTRPLSADIVALATRIPSAGAITCAFLLRPSGAVAESGEPADEVVWANDRALFYSIPAAGATAARLLYLDPRELTLSDLAAGPASDARRHDDLVQVVRALPFNRRSGDQLQVVRFDFRLADGVLRPAGLVRLTTAATQDTLPTLAGAEGGMVAYVATDDVANHHRLMTVPLAGGEPRQALPDQRGEVRLPRRLPDGDILVAGDAAGFFQPQRWTPGSDTLRPFTAAVPSPTPAGGVVLATTGNAGRLEAKLLRLPERVDLPTVLSLVAARNLAVNQRRALLAAALLEARRERLAHLPTFTASISHTPASGLLVAGTGIATGDVLATGLSRGLLGLIQPLLDFNRVEALAEAGRVRAEIAADVVEQELNDQLVDAAEHYLRACMFARMIPFDDQLVTESRQRRKRTGLRTAQGIAVRGDVLEAEQELELLTARAAHHRERLAYHRNRVLELCCLPVDATLPFACERYRFEEAPPAGFHELRRIALLNHPRVSAVRRAMIEQFFVAKTGPRYRPAASLETVYGQTRDRGGAPVEDYINLSLSGELPAGWLWDRDLHRTYQREVMRARTIDAEEQQLAVARQLDAAQVEWRRSRGELAVSERAVAGAREKVRVARLERAYPAAGAVDDDGGSALAMYRALVEHEERLADFAIAQCRVHHGLGLMRMLGEHCLRLRDETLDRDRASTWVWRTADLLADPASAQRFAAIAARHRLGRVYVYLASDSRLLADPESAERLALFVARCAERGIAVWGLLGEPEWLHGDGSALRLGVERIVVFNQRFLPGETGLAGLKLDLEPHSDPDWNDATRRVALLATYDAALATARATLPADLPLWVDLPAKAFRPEYAGLLDVASAHADGLTVMCYHPRDATVRAWVADALGGTTKPVEIALELAPQALPDESSGRWSDRQIDDLRRGLATQYRDNTGFAGIALHDYEGLLVRPADPASTP